MDVVTWSGDTAAGEDVAIVAGALSTTGESVATGVAGSEFVSDRGVFCFRW